MDLPVNYRSQQRLTSYRNGYLGCGVWWSLRHRLYATAWYPTSLDTAYPGISEVSKLTANDIT